jgi:oligogalacturonide transport system permease protein
MKIAYKKSGFTGNRANMGLLFIMPWLIGFLVFQLYPFVASFGYSLTAFRIIEKPRFIGFDNYISLFTRDPDFLHSMKVTFEYLFLSVPAKLVFALFIAVILNVKIRGINFYRTLYYLPSILGGSVAVSILWKLFFMQEGVLNAVLRTFGMEPVMWLSLDSAIFIISILQIWQFG